MQTHMQQQWVGVDTGHVRCGLAVADTTATLATALGVVDTEPRPSLGKRVLESLGERELRGLVVGLPLDLRGCEGESAQFARKLGEELAASLNCEFHFVDERFTTAEMHTRRREAGKSGMQRKADIDAWAASAILQSFLDRQRTQQ
jgi:putative Holliday junction resolvase